MGETRIHVDRIYRPVTPASGLRVKKKARGEEEAMTQTQRRLAATAHLEADRLLRHGIRA
jgi:hypothetical protein